MLTNSAGNLAKERRNIRNLAARQVDGVVLSSVLMEPDLADLESADIPAVLLNHSADAPGFNSVGVVLVSGAKSAVEHLIGHGHTNIALAMGTNTGNYFDGREQGWLLALAEAGPPESPIVRSPFTRDGGYTAGRRVLVSASLRALHEAGLSIPDDIAMASFDGSAEAEYSWPPLTTVSQPAREMAEAAVSALIGARRGQEPEHLIFPAKERVRRSCGCQEKLTAPETVDAAEG